MLTGSFDALTPHLALSAVEEAYGLRLDGTVSPYSSYVNRVYGVTDEDGGKFVAKFYRPNRWSVEAIEEEHRFILDCAQREIPVVAPLSNVAGETLSELALADGESDDIVPFALFPLMGGRNFDAEGDEEWFRIGALVGRCHAVGKLRDAPRRLTCRPDTSTAGFVQELLAEEVVHPDVERELGSICERTIARIAPMFDAVDTHRVHGDCHRGNILDRPDEGLIIIDFDDMMVGPPVQDLWLLLPDYAGNVRRELTMLLDGYEQFATFDRRSLRLIEPLRFMRMVYYLAWQARQRNDYWFTRSFPDWGTKQFWLKEVEDLRTQAARIEEHADPEWG